MNNTLQTNNNAQKNKTENVQQKNKVAKQPQTKNINRNNNGLVQNAKNANQGTKQKTANKNAKQPSKAQSAKTQPNKTQIKKAAKTAVKAKETETAVVKQSRFQGKGAGNYKITFLGGVEEIGKNIMAVEYGNDMIVIDTGSAFPGDDMPGIDSVMPDISYLKMNRNKIKGIFITHGHLDHIGAIQYVAKEFNVPIYGSRLTLALIENRLKEHKVKAKLIAVKAKDVVKLGQLSIEFVKVQHSISGAFGFAITSPAGTHFHTGDFKIDYTPIDGEGMDFIRLTEISKKGVLVMTSDSTNAERKGFSISEARVGETIDNILNQNKEKRVFIATFASNVHRVQQILNLGEKYGRKIAFSGRSMIKTMETAHKIGEVVFDKKNIIDISKIEKYEDNEVLVITTGTQGEPSSALVRMASGDFNKVEIGYNDLIILSSSAIPGNEKTINDVMNKLYRRGAEIIYESLAEVHTSGHAFQEELKTMFTVVNPKYFIPVHGEFRQQKAHAKLVTEMGMNERNIIIPDLGDQIGVTKNSIKKLGSVPSGVKLIDGIAVNDVGDSILRERMQLSEEGMCVVAITISRETGALSSRPELISRGFIYTREIEKVMEEARNVVLNKILDSDFKTQDWGLIKNNVRKALTTYFMKSIRRRPLVLPIVIETK